MAKRPPTKILEIKVHRSKRNKRLGHAVAVLFPCNHHRYLGICLYKGDDNFNFYRTQDCRVIKFDDYAILDKDVCKLCPYESEFITEDMQLDSNLDDFVMVLEHMDIDD